MKTSATVETTKFNLTDTTMVTQMSGFFQFKLILNFHKINIQGFATFAIKVILVKTKVLPKLKTDFM